MFVDPLLVTLCSEQPTYLPSQITHTPSTCYLELICAHLPTDVPMLTAVLVVQQLPRQRSRHTFTPTPPTFRCLLVLAGHNKPMLQRYVEKTQLTYPPKTPIPSIRPLLHRCSDDPCCTCGTTAATSRFDASCCTTVVVFV